MTKNTNSFFEIASDEDFRTWLPKELRGDETEGKRLSLYLLVDMARCTADDEISRLDEICQDSEWLGLYDDFEGDEWKRIGPRLIRIPDESKYLDRPSLGLPAQAVSYLLAGDHLSSLSEHLLRLREITIPDGGKSLFRFQDTIVMRELCDLLSAKQISIMLGGASKWAVPCICGGVGILSKEVNHVGGELALSEAQFELLNDRLLPHSIKAEVDEVDSAIFLDKDLCQITTDLRLRIEAARSYGIKFDDDVSLFCILGLQLPAGFDEVNPFSRILQSVRNGDRRFSAEVGKVSAEEWEQFESQIGFDVNN
ncbi:DUF4123 domain-containing protein [Jeongeupia wiesaeckerbachi]|uniref:DUF4123 domain-containing protein n=1 Tax=Jeongeupia wiesaeckerbachi TaxID=3051218 RepID=UPI003D809118